MSAKIVTIVQGQSIWDIAIQEYGSVTSVFDFIADNAFPDGLDTILTPGQKAKIISAPSDMGTLTYIQANNITIVGGKFLTYVRSYTYGLQTLSITNNGGDSWTIHVPYNAPSVSGTQTLVNASVSINFYHLGTETAPLLPTTITAPASYTYAGEGAGTYYVNVQYFMSDGTFIDVQMFVMVDGSGHVIRQANFNGMSSMSVSGFNVTAEADYAYINCTLSAFTVFLAFDETLTHYTVIGTSDPIVNDLLPPYSLIFLCAVFGIDLTEWTDGPFHTDLIGCAASLTTNI